MDNNQMKYMLISNIKCNSSMKLLYYFLLDSEEKQFTASYRKIGKSIGLSKSAVGRNIRKLRDIGVLTIESRFSEDGARLANTFRLRCT